jgi:hypothetical protein
MADTSVLNDAFRWNTLQRGIQEHNIRQAFEIFRSHGIEPLIFKGWAAARYYPLESPRSMGDIDLAVSSESYPNARALLEREDVRRLNIDLHDEFRHLDTVGWGDIFSNSILIEIDGLQVRIPREEDHLRLLCVHWLTDGGSNRDRLWDIYYLISRRPAKFDWSRCLDVVSPHRRRWITCTIGLAHRYLGLDISDLPFTSDATRIPGWVSKCVESEWRRGGNIEPVLTSIYDRKVLVDQLKRRIPPNPIRAVIEAEGNIDRRLRLDYQLRVLGRRSLPFLKDLGKNVKRRFKEDWGYTNAE